MNNIFFPEKLVWSELNSLALHCNINFILDNILSNFITRSKNYENCNFYWMNFVRNGIINSLIE
jgi:hypothetical protein